MEIKGGHMRENKKICFNLKWLLVLGIVFLFLSFSAIAFAQSEEIILKQGMIGDDIVKLQMKLQEYGYYQDEIDGIFGIGTKLALINFQLDCKLEADGVAGMNTFEVLRNFRAQDAVNRGQSEGRWGRQIAYFAQQFIGVPYLWAGQSRAGFDCSGFIYYVFSNCGIKLPRMADEQFEVGVFIDEENLRAGDLVFFTTYESGASHVGIYIGNGHFIHASSGAGSVVITPMRKQYYLERYLGARRIIE